MQRRLRAWTLCYLLLGIFLIGGLVGSTSLFGNRLHAQGELEVATTSPIPHPSSEGPYLIADIAEQATPAVVLITVEWPAPTRQPIPDPFSWFFSDPFGPFRPGPQQRSVSWGTGFLIDQEGHIFTNQHVVGNAGQGQTITVRLHPTSSVDLDVPATIVGADYDLDLAILKLEEIPPELEGNLPTLTLGDSDRARPGEWVIAIGNPYGYEHTVTVGVLSAKGREITVYDRERNQARPYRDLLQTDAAINQGNSGGPLFNLRGEVIGINTAVRADGQGIGFAIPINTALAVRDELITEGRVLRPQPETPDIEWTTQVLPITLGQDPDTGTRPFIGIEYMDVTQELAENLGLPEAKGIIVVRVLRDTAAQRAGLQVYDVITHFHNTEVETGEDLRRALADLQPGQRIMASVLRHVP